MGVTSSLQGATKCCCAPKSGAAPMFEARAATEEAPKDSSDAPLFGGPKAADIDKDVAARSQDTDADGSSPQPEVADANAAAQESTPTEAAPESAAPDVSLPAPPAEEKEQAEVAATSSADEVPLPAPAEEPSDFNLQSVASPPPAEAGEAAEAPKTASDATPASGSTATPASAAAATSAPDESAEARGSDPKNPEESNPEESRPEESRPEESRRPPEKVEAVLGGKEESKEETVNFKDGSVYTGQLRDEKRHGQGSYRSPNKQYKGQWVNDFRDGHGKQIWKDGRVYEGEFSGGKLHGFGKMEWKVKDGTMAYEGQYQENLKQGKGKFTWADGRMYDGEWHHGTRHGEGVFHSSWGVKKQGIWTNDKLVRWLENQDTSEPVTPRAAAALDAAPPDEGLTPIAGTSSPDAVASPALKKPIQTPSTASASSENNERSLPADST